MKNNLSKLWVNWIIISVFYTIALYFFMGAETNEVYGVWETRSIFKAPLFFIGLFVPFSLGTLMIIGLGVETGRLILAFVVLTAVAWLDIFLERLVPHKKLGKKILLNLIALLILTLIIDILLLREWFSLKILLNSLKIFTP